MLLQVARTERQSHFLTDMANSTKVVDFVIQFAFPAEELAQYTRNAGRSEPIHSIG